MSNKAKRSGKRLRLDDDQATALTTWQSDFKRAYPAMQEAAAVAQRLFQELYDAPRWDLVDSEKPQWAQQQDEPEEWTVGHAKVNITDNRNPEGDSK